MVTAFAACNNKPSTPAQADILILPPVNRIVVYTDERPRAFKATTKVMVPLKEKVKGQIITSTPKRSIEKISPRSIPPSPEEESGPLEKATAPILKEVTNAPSTLPVENNVSNANDVIPAANTEETTDTEVLNAPEKKKEKAGIMLPRERSLAE